LPNALAYSAGTAITKKERKKFYNISRQSCKTFSFFVADAPGK
jgi:hypothetical protein